MLHHSDTNYVANPAKSENIFTLAGILVRQRPPKISTNVIRFQAWAAALILLKVPFLVAAIVILFAITETAIFIAYNRRSKILYKDQFYYDPDRPARVKQFETPSMGIY